MKPIDLELYSYGPLPTPTSIRLLTLYPGTYESPIACSLSEEFYDRSDYEALSYEWRTSANEELFPITCNVTKALFVRRNLRDALLQLRETDKPRKLWIDALCINQADDNEKSIQVNRMHMNYQHASQVIAWLGPEDDDVAREMESVCHIHKFWLSISATMRARTNDVKGDSIPRHRCAAPKGDDLDGQPVSTPTVTDWKKIAAFLHRSFFTRLWMVQELVLPSSVILLCGSHSLDLRCLAEATAGTHICLHWIHPLDVRQMISAEIVDHFSSVIPLRSFARRRDPNGFEFLKRGQLWAILMQTRDLECFDPRDKIFAVLTLLPDDARANVRADYSMSLEAVYVNVVRWVLHGRLSDIFLDRLTPPTHNSESLPSWVPDWREKSKAEIRIREARPFRVCGWSGELEIRCRFPSTNELEARSIRVANISATDEESLQSPPVPSASNLDLTRAFQLTSTISGDKGDNDGNEKGATIFAFLRTMLADTWGDLAGADKADPKSIEDIFTTTQPFWDDSNKKFVLTAQSAIDKVTLRCQSHKFFVASTEKMMGLCPKHAREGDEIHIIMNCNVPVVLRSIKQNREQSRGDLKRFSMIGVCYLDEYMDGKYIKDLARDAYFGTRQNVGQGDESLENDGKSLFDGFFEQWKKEERVLKSTESVIIV